MPVMFSVELPLLLSVTLLAVLVVVSLRVAKVTAVDESDATGPIPVPESATVGAVPCALVLTVTVAVRVPRAVGVNVTPTVQVAPAASVLVPLGQLLARAKSPAAVPLNVILLKLSAAVPLLLTVMICAALVVPTTWLP